MSHKVFRAIISNAQRQDPEQTEDEMETIVAIQNQFGKTVTASENDRFRYGQHDTGRKIHRQKCKIYLASKISS
jgi:hypothetical protein